MKCNAVKSNCKAAFQIFAATKFWSDDPSVMRKLSALKNDAICLSTISAETGDCLDLVTDELTAVGSLLLIDLPQIVTVNRLTDSRDLTCGYTVVNKRAITCLSMCILLIWYGPFSAASEATTASKQPQRSNLTSDLKSVTPITYLSMCILFIWYGPS